MQVQSKIELKNEPNTYNATTLTDQHTSHMEKKSRDQCSGPYQKNLTVYNKNNKTLINTPKKGFSVPIYKYKCKLYLTS